MWWENAVIYQVYIRSFQDSNGDGIGDLPGVTSRLDHIARLGADAVWLSPIYRSPNDDFGYDVSDFLSVDPALGSLEDFDELTRAAHALGVRVVLDFVPCHTSIEHPWFRERPDYYVWADPPLNNWRATFGGPAWERDPVTGRYYLHSFYPEQADLDWRKPDVRRTMSATLGFWLERGADGFRLDALDRLLKDPELRDDPPARGPLALPAADPEDALLEHTHSRNAPDIALALQAIRDAVGGAFLTGEVYLPASQLGPYLELLDVAFAFEVLHAIGDAPRLRMSIAGALAAGKPGWVLSNHDFSRFPNRTGAQNARAATLLLLSLPGPAFMLQGDEIGLPDGPAPDPPLDRAGRDAFRTPMPWDRSAGGGFTTGTPWLPTFDPAERNVADQDADPGSELALHRALIALRGELDADARLRESEPDTIVLDRGSHVVAVNLGEHPRAAPRVERIVIEARAGDGAEPGVIPPHGGWIGMTIR